MSDAGWVRKILRGDRHAGERFVSLHYPYIYRMLVSLTDDRDVAEDLTQQTFTRAWAALNAYRGEARLKTWLHRIAYREYTHWLRDRHEWLPLNAALGLADAAPTEGLLTIMVDRALARLTPELRETFVLFTVQELSVREVAAILEIPAGTVKSRLHTAREQLRVLLDDRAPASTPHEDAQSEATAIREVAPNELQALAAKRSSG